MKKIFLATCALATAWVYLPAMGAQSGAPKYEVDVTWPKPLPDRWVIGGLGGVCVDAQDHVFLLNRQDVLEGDLNAGHLAPPVIEIDPAGNLVNSWAIPNYLTRACTVVPSTRTTTFGSAARPPA